MFVCFFCCCLVLFGLSFSFMVIVLFLLLFFSHNDVYFVASFSWLLFVRAFATAGVGADRSPLHLACWAGKAGMIRLLLKHR